MCYESELTPNMLYLEMIKDLFILRLLQVGWILSIDGQWEW
jgi:hypothetical protein